jgi:hypothetical protein
MNIEQALRKNIKELQEQLQRAYRRIKVLTEDIEREKKKAFYNEEFSQRDRSGWAMMENPPEYIEEGKDELPYPIDKTENDV